jgi:hypothetical protein
MKRLNCEHNFTHSFKWIVTLAEQFHEAQQLVKGITCETSTSNFVQDGDKKMYKREYNFMYALKQWMALNSYCLLILKFKNAPTSDVKKWFNSKKKSPTYL